MRKTLLITLILCAITIPVFGEKFKTTGTVDVYFSPNGGPPMPSSGSWSPRRLRFSFRRTPSQVSPLPRRSSMPTRRESGRSLDKSQRRRSTRPPTSSPMPVSRLAASDILNLTFIETFSNLFFGHGSSAQI